MPIVKNKNIIEFRVDEAKAYRYDMNSGVLYGLKKVAMKNVPKVVSDMIRENRETSNVARYLCDWTSTDTQKERFANVKMISFFDRLDSAGFPVLYGLTDYYISIFNKHFKEIHKEFVEESTPIHFLREKLCEYDFTDWLKDSGLKIDDHFTRDKALFLKSGGYPKKWLPRLAYYLCKEGLWEFFNSGSLYGTGVCLLHEKFHSFVRMTEAMGRVPEKGNFIRQYYEIQAEYLLRKKEFDNNLLYKNQIAHADALNFSHGEFEVVIPTTSEEFANEGNSQGNCVARIYLPKVINGETNVVFVRRKNALDTSYITCEVCEGKIYQFLLRYNRRVDVNSPEKEFYNAYAKHLAQNWGE